MGNFATLDVLILYNGGTASSPLSKARGNISPFATSPDNLACDTSYAYFLTTCTTMGLTAGLASSKDIVGAGKCKAYWTYHHSSWHKVRTPCYSANIFDKFSPKHLSGKTVRSLLFSSPLVKPYNLPHVFNLFFDKQATYDDYVSHAIPTIPLSRSTLSHIHLAVNKLISLRKSHLEHSDFTSDIIMKDRFGAGGWHVYKIKSGDYRRIQTIMQKHSDISFILQPFVKFDLGFKYKHHQAATDIRLIYLNGAIVQTYLRMAKPGDFRCNEHQGGSSIYLKIQDIPDVVRSRGNYIASTLDNRGSLYALDFIIANSGTPYFIEGNTGPGLSWNENIKKETFMGKKLIRSIVQTLASRIQQNSLTSSKASGLPHYPAFSPIPLI